MHQELFSISNSSGYACPIAGLQIEEGAVTIGPLRLVRFNRAEWEMLERRYVLHRQPGICVHQFRK